MRKIVFVIVLTVFTINFTSAQLLKIGIKGGLNYANFNSPTIQTDALTSYHVGFIVEISLLKSLCLQPEILYSTQGASYKNIVEDFKSELGYMSVPVLAKLHLGKTLSIEAGPQFSYLLSKKVNASTNVNEFDFALAGGLGIRLTNKVFVQGRYTYGLTKIEKNADFKNAVAQLSIGLIL